MIDLIVMVADKNAEYAVRGAIDRFHSLQTRAFSTEFRVHPGHDGGARNSGPELLSSERRRFSAALLILDYEGCGDTRPPTQIESDLDRQLAQAWGDRAKSIVVQPEIDAWVWGVDNALVELLRWPKESLPRDWLRQQGFTFDHEGKPLRPKEALESLVESARQARSSALYSKITSKISLDRCTDSAFYRVKQTLQRWFPPEQ